MFFSKFRFNPTIPGEKVNLRPLKKDDILTIYHWLDDQELAELAFGLSVSSTDASSLVPAYKQEIGNHKSSFLGIESKTGELIGFCSHILFKSENKARIGILIGNKDYWNQGFGRDAVMVFLHYLFFKKKLKVIELDTAPSNVRAQRCFVACGFKLVNRSDKDANGKFWFEVKREEFPN